MKMDADERRGYVRIASEHGEADQPRDDQRHVHHASERLQLTSERVLPVTGRTSLSPRSRARQLYQQ
jgi:hypothetical protein